MGIDPERIHFVGNPMIDTLLQNLDSIERAAALSTLRPSGPYAVATLHRPGNVDDPMRAAEVVSMLNAVARLVPVVVPLHPRGRPTLEAVGLRADDRLRVIEPLGYLDFLGLVRGATLVVTDSGGIQEETTALKIPCLTVRPNTERPVTISHGTNRLVEPGAVPALVASILENGIEIPAEGPPLWDGHAGERIGAEIEAWLRTPAGPPG